VFYQAEADNKIKHSLFRPYDGVLQDEDDTTIEVSWTKGTEVHASLTGALDHSMWMTRLGASNDTQARYHVATDLVNNEWNVLWQLDGSVYVTVLSDTFTMPEGNRAMLIANGPGTDTTMGEPLDVINVAPGVILVLYMTYTTSATVPLTKVRLASLDPTLSLDWDIPMVDQIDRTICHGGIAVNAGDNEVAWFAHDSGRSCYEDGVLQADQLAVRDRINGIRYGTRNLSDGAFRDRAELTNHRMATRPIYYENKLYCGVQQWADYTHLTESWESYLAFAGVDGAIRPRTTILATFDVATNKIEPVAYLDAGSSKTCEYAESELQVHLPRMIIEGDQFVFPNRLVIRAEDLSCWIGDEAGTDGLRLGNQESPADAMVRIHRIAKGNADLSEIRSARFGDGIVLSTAIPLWYDGKFFGELGPLDSPEIVYVRDSRTDERSPTAKLPQGFNAGSEGGEGDLAAWRKMQIVYGYFDAKGNKHRSAPSSVLYVRGLQPADAQADPDIGAPDNWAGKLVTMYYTLPLSLLPSDLEYFVEVYVSDGADDSPQLIDTSTITLTEMPSISSPRSMSFQLVRYYGGSGGQTFKKPARTSQDIYTAGGELPADPWPSFTIATVTSTRMMALDAVNKGKVLVSKRFQDFIAPEYNALLDINLGDERDLLCIGKMDDKTIIFEKDDIHVIYGDGPENNGTGEDFAVHYISTDVGCEDQESIVECPAGLVFFRKERGFYLLDRQLNIKYIGDKVHDLSKGIDVVAAELVSASGEVRFLCAVTGAQGDPDGGFAGIGTHRPPTPVRENKAPDSNFAIVWDYEKDQWSVFANYPGAASTIHQGRYTRLLSDWSIWQEREEADRIFTDPTGDNRTLLRTPWIPLAENGQGYGRLHRMNILGRYFATLGQTFAIPFQYYACDIQVKIWYDYEEGRDVTPQTKLFKYQDFWFDPFSKRNLRAQRLQFAITPAEGRGRCQAVKLEFEELLPEDSPDGKTYALGQGFEISSIDFEIGVDQRVTRLLPQAVLK
jgi:hypothetical protein